MKSDKTRTDRNVERVEKHIKTLSLIDLINSVTDDDLKADSYIYQQLMTVDAPEPTWVKFASVMGRWEVAIGEAFRNNQRRTNLALQLLSVMMNAQDNIQLLTIYKKLKKNRDQLPTMIKSVVGGMLGASMVHQQAPPVILPAPQDDWTSYETQLNAPAAVAYGAVFLEAGQKARRADPPQEAVGIAVSVSGNVAQVATEGQKIKNVPADKMQDLNAGDMLYTYHLTHKNRYLITLAEASLLLPIGSFLKPIGKVLRNDTEQRTIVVVDRPAINVPVP